jgi:7,8-dihydropterin-6-yl-methyl-4-(beta-D-ribofuranosyl)aminobenzene 5'-phosphate synthase
VREIGRQIMEKVQGPVYSGHCTGEKAYGVLEGVMGETLHRFQTGSSIEV